MDIFQVRSRSAVTLCIIALMMVSCGKTTTHEQQSANIVVADSMEEQYVDYDSITDEETISNLIQMRQAIIDGDVEALAAVTSFPIYRAYPDKDIEDVDGLKRYMDILFDDSIKSIFKNSSISDWHRMGWRGIMLDDGVVWADDYGKLFAINIESEKYRSYVEGLRREEDQALNESAEWVTKECLLTNDSTLFLRIEEFANVMRLHIFMRGESNRYYTFNGTRDIQGSCHNDLYIFATQGDGTVSVWVSSPICSGGNGTDHLIEFPHTDMYLPKELQDTAYYCNKAVWREVNPWW